MNFKIYLSEQIKKHPSVRPRDVVKMCYQAAYGAEHLLHDSDKARKYLEKEFSETAAADGDLYEQISDDVCRINISAWKYRNLPVEWLFRMFLASCTIRENGSEIFLNYLQEAETFIRSGGAGFSISEWYEYLDEYKKLGMPAVHHSAEYRENERPAYRIVNSRFSRILSVLEKAAEYLSDDKPCIIAIDGRAASGKTTLAAYLQIVLDADIIHTDDFFVPPALRSAKRFETPGENIHHERFATEVLPFIGKREPFSYKIFDCGIADYNGRREIETKPFRIVEGAYSTHPIFGRYADITVFSDVPPDEQIKRILTRNGEKMLEMFKSKWIPMEEEYFSHYAIKEKADMVV